MPTNEKILGFGNIWYADAIKSSLIVTLQNGKNIYTITSPYFLATKLEAFKTRGKNNYLLSHDFEDIISVIDGRKEVADEVLASPIKLKRYLSQNFQSILQKTEFLEALPGLLNYGKVTNERVTFVIDKLSKIISE